MSHKLSALLRASIAGVMLMIPSSSTDAFAGQALSPRELQLLFPGRFQAVVKGSIVISITASRDGSLLAEFLTRADTGQWSIRSGKLCIRFASWLGGRTSCSAVVADEGWYHASDVMFRQAEGLTLAVRPDRR